MCSWPRRVLCTMGSEIFTNEASPAISSGTFVSNLGSPLEGRAEGASRSGCHASGSQPSSESLETARGGLVPGSALKPRECADETPGRLQSSKTRGQRFPRWTTWLYIFTLYLPICFVSSNRFLARTYHTLLLLLLLLLSSSHLKPFRSLHPVLPLSVLIQQTRPISEITECKKPAISTQKI